MLLINWEASQFAVYMSRLRWEQQASAGSIFTISYAGRQALSESYRSLGLNKVLVEEYALKQQLDDVSAVTGRSMLDSMTGVESLIYCNNK